MLNVSIVTYRTPIEEMERCLASLDTPEVGTIYVVDNASDPMMEAWCCGREKVIYMPGSNAGYGAGHNRAIRLSLDHGVPFHLVINSDLEFSPVTLPAMLAEMARRPGVGLMHPRMLNPDGTLQTTVRLLPTPLDVFGRRFLPSRLMARRNARYTLAGRDPGRDLEADYFQGSFMLLRTAALRCTGLFDERFFMYPEDIDLTRRMADAGWHPLYWPGATVVHRHRAASYRSWRMTWIHCTNMVRYFNKWGWWHDPRRRSLNRSLLGRLAHPS